MRDIKIPIDVKNVSIINASRLHILNNISGEEGKANNVGVVNFAQIFRPES